MTTAKKMICILLLTVFSLAGVFTPSKARGATDFPAGTATPSELCGACHRAIYREFATGFGADLKYPGIVYQSGQEKALTLPANVSAT